MTEAEILEIVRATLARPESDDCVTVRELCRVTKIGEKKMRELLYAWQREGRVQPIWAVRTDPHGISRRTPVWRFLRSSEGLVS